LHSKYIRQPSLCTTFGEIDHMKQAAPSANRHSALLAERLVRYSELRPCTTAFIDTRTPGSAEKENFTIIGPGVAENPDQHVHIDIPHGFNIGGARQPPGCVNSQHSHETAEVFVIHSGTWAFYLGPNREDGKVTLGPGDTISIPVHVFRGFENVGSEVGYMFAVLGGDNPGHVTWSPYVFDNAKEYGLILLDDGSLVDTRKGETVPAGKRAMPATTDTDVAALRRLKANEMGDCVVTRAELQPTEHRALPQLREFPIIGASGDAEGIAAGKMGWSHGFQLRHVCVDPGTATSQHQRHEEEVILMQTGVLSVELPEGNIELHAGDVFTVPIESPRVFANKGNATAEAYIVRGGDQPRPPTMIT
jgi:mannose-6-phosphate isomerase-like protein (cupin superfamily)